MRKIGEVLVSLFHFLLERYALFTVSVKEMAKMKKIIETKLYNQSLTIPKTKDFYLFYVLKGQITLAVNEESIQMTATDIYVVNPNKNIEIDCENAVFVQLKIYSNDLLKLTNYKKVVIVCDSTKRKDSIFTKLQFLLDTLIRGNYEDNYDSIYNLTNLFEFLSFLITNFANNIFIEDYEEERKNSILVYIHSNYTSDLSLQGIADTFGFTPQYFSKYFKKTFKVNFLKFLTNVRLEQATIDLVNTDYTILKIAMDHGFSNHISFSKAFKNEYGLNPSEFRRVNNQENVATDDLSYYEVEYLLSEKTVISEKEDHLVEVEVGSEQESICPFWFNTINLGSISKIFDHNLNKQIMELKEEMPFKTARVILDNSNYHNESFSVEEKVLDFLLNLDFSIVLVLDYRHISNDIQFESYFENFLNHFINRYGSDNLKLITFELLYNTRFSTNKAKKYAVFFNKITTILKKLQLFNNLVGPGLLMDSDGENLINFLNENQQLKKITINIAPYSIEQYDNKLYINRKPDDNYIVNQYDLAKKISGKYRISEVIISSWKDALNEISSINDSSYRGAYILKNMLESYGKINCLPIELPFDIMSDMRYDKPLAGLSGIISRDGIKKPSYFSLKFLNKLDKFLLYKDDTILISNSNTKYFQIVCHNCKTLNYKFYNQEKLGIISSDINSFFEEYENKSIKIKITGIANGKYFLKSRRISEKQGDCFYMFQEMGIEQSSFFGRDELDYLVSVSKPVISGQQIEVENNQLELNLELEPNEIRHLHLIYIH